MRSILAANRRHRQFNMQVSGFDAAISKSGIGERGFEVRYESAPWQRSCRYATRPLMPRVAEDGRRGAVVKAPDGKSTHNTALEGSLQGSNQRGTKQGERMIAGIDVGGTKIAVGLIDETGKVRVRTDTPIHVERGPQVALRGIMEILRAQEQQTGLVIEGIGIGCTGPVDPLTGELGDVNTLPGWQAWNPVSELSAELKVTVAMENDADAAALGEARWGSGKGKRSLVCITVGTGIGAGVILNGELYRGVQGSHPEIGHHIVDPAGPYCTCGAYGCWESLACGPAMEQWYAEQDGVSVGQTAKEICALARAGDRTALLAVRRGSKYLGMGIANVVTMFMPEAIVLGGSMMQSADLLLDDLQAIVTANCRIVPYQLCKIAVASLGPDVGLIGAAQVWHHRFSKSKGQYESRCV